MSAAFAVIAIVALIVSWIAVFKMIDELKDKHPEVYEAMGEPTSRMVFWHYRCPFRPAALGQLDRFLRKKEFRHLSGSRARTFGWTTIVAGDLTIVALVLSFVATKL